jgi:O-antigen/teichoic acid export membrane protein
VGDAAGDPIGEAIGEALEEGTIATRGEAFATLRRRILRGSAWVMGGKVATIVLGVAINSALARLLTPNELGAYFTTYALVVIGASIAQLGLDRAVVRFVSAAIADDDPGRARAAIRRTLVYGGLGALTMGAILFLGLGDWLATTVFRSDAIAAVMPIAAGWLIVTALQSLLVETFRGLQRFDLSTVLDALLVDTLSASIFGVLVLAGAGADLEAIVLLSAGATLTITVLAAGLLLGRVRGLHGEGDVGTRELLSYAWPLLITNIAILLLGRGVDLWILGAYQTQADVAIYGAASRLVVFVATPFLIVQGVTPPIVAELHQQGRIRDMERALRGAASIAGLPSFLVLLFFILFGSTVMSLVYGDFYAQGATPLVILSIGRLVAVWTGSCAVVLMMTGHQRVAMVVTISAGILSVVSGILVAPRFGIVGVAVTTTTAQIVQNLVQLYLAHRLVGVWTHILLSPKPFFEFLTGKGLPGAKERRR